MLVLFSMALAQPAFSQEANVRLPVTTTGTLGGEMEELFRDFLDTCPGLVGPLTIYRRKENDGGFYLKQGGDNHPTVSAIDPMMLSVLDLKKDDGPKTGEPLDISVGQLFAMVGNQENFQADRIGSLQRLAINEDNVSTLFSDAYSSAQYRTTCASYIGAVGRTSGGFSFPFATMKANFEADRSQTDEASLQVVSGTFDSPLWLMWDRLGAAPGQTSSNQFYAASVFWHWRHRRELSSESDGEDYLISQFKGIIANRRYDSNASAGASGSFNSKLSIPFLARASASAQGDVRNTRDVTLNNFAIYLPQGESELRFQRVPTAAQLAATMRDIFATSAPIFEDQALVEGRRGEVRVDLYAFSSDLCDRGLWEIRDDDVADVESDIYDLDDLTPTFGPDGSTVCVAELEFDDRAAGEANWDMEPFLVSRRSVEGVYLKLPLPRIVFVSLAQEEEPVPVTPVVPAEPVEPVDTTIPEPTGPVDETEIELLPDDPSMTEAQPEVEVRGETEPAP